MDHLQSLPQHSFCFIFWSFGRETCRILAPWPGLTPAPSALEGEVLTTGPPGRSLTQGFWAENWYKQSIVEKIPSVVAWIYMYMYIGVCVCIYIYIYIWIWVGGWVSWRQGDPLRSHVPPLHETSLPLGHSGEWRYRCQSFGGNGDTWWA